MVFPSLVKIAAELFPVYVNEAGENISLILRFLLKADFQILHVASVLKNWSLHVFSRIKVRGKGKTMFYKPKSSSNKTLQFSIFDFGYSVNISRDSTRAILQPPQNHCTAFQLKLQKFFFFFKLSVYGCFYKYMFTYI